MQGMPEKWTNILMKSNISKQEQAKNPEAILSVLRYFETANNQSPKFMTIYTNNGN